MIEVRVGVAREAVGAAELAPAIRIDRPVKGERAVRVLVQDRVARERPELGVGGLLHRLPTETAPWRGRLDGCP